MDESPLPAAPLLIACDDAATLEAALDLLDNCDGPVTNPSNGHELDAALGNFSEFLAGIPAFNPKSGNEHKPVTPPITDAVSTEGKRRRTTPKQEICHLRAQERELAMKLENLRLEAYDQKRRGRTGKGVKVLPFWKKIASRQYQNRMDSERENRRLRSLVNIHLGRAKRLKLAWKKQLAEEGYCKDSSKCGQISDEHLAPDTAEVMDQLTRQADAVYATLDAFREGFGELPRNAVPFLEHSDSYAVPFERQTVDRAMWNALLVRFRGSERQVHVTEDTITCYVLRNFRMATMDIRLRVRWVGRKHREADRTVIITHVLVEPLHIVAAKIGFRETQALIISACQSPTEPAATTVSRIDSFARVTGHGPEFGNGDGLRSWMGSSDGMAVRNVWRNVFQLRKSAIEDQIFEETRPR